MWTRKRGSASKWSSWGTFGKRKNLLCRNRKNISNNASPFYENVRGPFCIWLEFLCSFCLEAIIPAVLVQIVSSASFPKSHLVLEPWPNPCEKNNYCYITHPWVRQISLLFDKNINISLIFTKQSQIQFA